MFYGSASLPCSAALGRWNYGEPSLRSQIYADDSGGDYQIRIIKTQMRISIFAII